LSPNDFTDLDVIEQRLARFEVRYNTAAKPFKWKFATSDTNTRIRSLPDGVAARLLLMLPTPSPLRSSARSYPAPEADSCAPRGVRRHDRRRTALRKRETASARPFAY
jgi:hypothetical protein